MFSFFFFQAEDGIRDDLVTGVQTCALPISQIQYPTAPAPRSTAARRADRLRFGCREGVLTKAVKVVLNRLMIAGGDLLGKNRLAGLLLYLVNGVLEIFVGAAWCGRVVGCPL